MRAFLIITVLLLFYCSTSHSQNLVVHGKTWTYLLGGDYPEPSIEGDMCYKIEGDTTIQEMTYKKLGFWHSCNNYRYIRGFIRETEDGKVYFLNNANHPEEEYLLYDFGLEVGDTAFYEYEQDTSFYALDSTGTNEEGRKLFYISKTHDRKETWIERVGAQVGLLKEIITGGAQYFTCCFLNDDLLYHNSEFESCYFEKFSVDTGNDTTFCGGYGQTDSLFLGNNIMIENGIPPYSYRWETRVELSPNLVFTASDFLSDTTAANPYFTDGQTLTNTLIFYLHVTDAENNTATDSINVQFSVCGCPTGYSVIQLNKGDSVFLDAGTPSGKYVKYYYEPSTGLTNPDSSATWCKPVSTMNYNLVKVDSFGCVCSCHAYEIRVNEGTYSQQDYSPIHPQREALFRNQANRIIGLRIDSVKISSDTILYPFTTIREVSPDGCFSADSTSWIGEKVVIKPDGSNLFFNREGEPITLKTRAQLNESWIAFHRADTFQVEATVKNVEFEEILGLNDSVKTITFRVSDQHGNTLGHDLNSLKVKISQNYGFVEILNFNLFPDFIVRYPADRLGKHTVVGLTNPEVGVQNLKWFDVYDFNAGDELHIQERRTGNAQFSSIIKYDNRCIYKYLERTDYADSIVYRYARKQSIETVYNDSSSLVIFNDTVRSVILANPVFDKLPGEPVIDTFSFYSFYMRDNEFRMKIDPAYTEIFFFINENCFAVPVIEGCLYEKLYIEGLGGPYYSCTGYVGDTEERKLVYYRKGETEWGERLVITGITAVKRDNMVKVFPNPSKNEINIQIHSNERILSLELVDLTGNRVYQNGTVRGNNFKLDVSEFPKGIYILKIETGQGEVSQRVVIQ